MFVCPYCKKEIEPVEETVSAVTVSKDNEGRMKTWTEEMRDCDGILMSKRVDDSIYFDKSGDIDTIKQQIFDGEGSLRSEKIVKHFEDGRQPEVIELINKIDIK